MLFLLFDTYMFTMRMNASTHKKDIFRVKYDNLTLLWLSQRPVAMQMLSLLLLRLKMMGIDSLAQHVQ